MTQEAVKAFQIYGHFCEICKVYGKDLIQFSLVISFSTVEQTIRRVIDDN